jgi:hypothetical protein
VAAAVTGIAFGLSGPLLECVLTERFRAKTNVIQGNPHLAVCLHSGIFLRRGSEGKTH